MTVDYSLGASQIIIDYLWDKLTSTSSVIGPSGTILDPNDYQVDLVGSTTAIDIIPIFMSQQDAINSSVLDGETHIIYDWVADGYEDNWLICRDSMMFTIYAKEQRKIMEIQNLMLDLFRRMDDSARDLNAYLPSQSPWIFYTVSLVDLTSPEPQREKSGWFAGQVVIRYKYGRQVNSQTGRFA